MFVFALILRLVLTQHFTFLINSAAHVWGTQPYSNAHTARDNWLLSFFSFGEGYHNYHHSFQADYRNGPRLYNWDPSKWLIWLMSKVGLASKLRRSPLDVTLGKIFENAKRNFEARLAAAGETVEDWRTATADAQDAVRLALQEKLVTAEHRCEEALQELQAARATLQTKISDGVGVFERSPLRRRLREAQRSAREALDHWQELGRAYIEAASATPIPIRAR
jgi:stearoyl-CoA desaturase (delta-9 desaturase)